MRICFLAPADSSHTEKWCGYFVERGHEVHVVALDDGDIAGVHVHNLATSASAQGSDAQKLGYLTRGREARNIMRSIAPDVVHAHYASSYGTLAALACEAPYLLSVWGSDIFDFPTRSPLHKAMLKFSLRHATQLLSTSQAMADEASKYTAKQFAITPFGVDTSLFYPRAKDHGDDFVVAIVKSLSKTYGIDVLLRAVAGVVDTRPDIPIKVRIAGSGPEEQSLKDLSSELGLAGRVEWLGYISQDEAARVWADADVGVVPSYFESFGVAALEAQASGTPVVVSDAPGLLETTIPTKTSLVFPRGDVAALAACLILLHDDKALRRRLAEFGVENVANNFSYDACFGKIEGLVQEFVARNGAYHARVRATGRNV